MSAIFDLKEDDYILGVWFIAWETCDWVASIQKKDDGDYQLRYRFRYYNEESTSPFDGKDRKSIYSGTTPFRDEEKIIAEIDNVQNRMIEDRPALLRDRIIVRGNAEKLIDALKGKEWAHIKKLKNPLPN